MLDKVYAVSLALVGMASVGYIHLGMDLVPERTEEAAGRSLEGMR